MGAKNFSILDVERRLRHLFSSHTNKLHPFTSVSHEFGVYTCMLPGRDKGAQGPLVVMLHWLGGGAQTWTEVSRGLAARGVHCVALDLPGFGEAAKISGFTVSAMVEQVIETIRGLRGSDGVSASQPWFLAGHSMGGKLSGVIARRALDGEPGLDGLGGLLLVSPSPPTPEPMSDSKRSEMLAALGESTGDPAKDFKAAAKFVDENTGKLPLPEGVRERAIQGVLGMNRTAFRHWLESGSNENWGKFVGEIALPALVLAGTEDGALGPNAQRETTLTHLPQGDLITLQACGHLAPLERPGELIERFTQFLTAHGARLLTPKQTPDARFEGVITSDHVSPRTRDVMEERLAASKDWNYQPKTFSVAELLTLRALTSRIVPDAGFDLAARIDAQLAEGNGDGWRFAVLPPDIEAWHKGLHSLVSASNRAHDLPFLSLFAAQQDEMLTEAAAGKLGRGLLGTLHLGQAADAYTAAEMQRWFSDVRAECTRLYVGDPRTMERIGYTGFADDLGFTQITIGTTEEFER